MELENMELSYRAKQFSDLISKTIYTDALQSLLDIEQAMQKVMHKLQKLRVNHATLYIIGNGGSAAVASHALIDFVNVAKLHVQVLHESSLITCMANDYGYENAYARVLKQCLKSDDMLIAISSSGKSLNICNAAKVAMSCGAGVITLTGFDPENTLRQLGHDNFWLNSSDYGYVEVGHQFILHNLSDRFGIEDKIKAAAVDKDALAFMD